MRAQVGGPPEWWRQAVVIDLYSGKEIPGVLMADEEAREVTVVVRDKAGKIVSDGDRMKTETRRVWCRIERRAS